MNQKDKKLKPVILPRNELNHIKALLEKQRENYS